MTICCICIFSMSDNLDTDLRAITLNASDNAPPKTLRLDEMFARVQRWGEARRELDGDQSPASTRPSSPSWEPRLPFPLPKPLRDGEMSALGGLMAYPELLPLVVRHFDHPRELAILCRVHPDFRSLAQKKLYHRIWVRPWEDGCRLKVRMSFISLTQLVRLFRTLSSDPSLCRLAKHLGA